MATVIRPELSIKNKYHIDKHRHYELKHFCLQYPTWMKECEVVNLPSCSSMSDGIFPSTPGDPTAKHAMKRAYYKERIKLIEQVAKDADEELFDYILKAVTEGLSYTYLKSRLEIPCGREMYYDRYRKFFWLLNKARN